MNGLRGGLAVLFVLVSTVGVADQAPIGHIAFYYTEATEGDGAPEIYNDFLHHSRGAVAWLTRYRISHSFHWRMPVIVKAAPGRPVTFQKDDLKGDLGTILLKRDGTHKVLYGVNTGVDLIIAAKKYFKID